MALLTALLAGAFFLVGAIVAWGVKGNSAVKDFSVAIAFGSLACVAAFDLAPEALEACEELGVLPVVACVVIGIAALVLLDKAMPGHHAHSDEHEASHIGLMAVIAVSVHNIAEGAAIFTVASQDPQAGLAMALGVGLHNAPMGMLFYSVMEESRARGVAVLAAAALSTFVGGLLMFALGSMINETVSAAIVCVALGMIAYILVAELLPAMVHGKNVGRSVLGIAIGAAFVLVGMLLG